MGFEQANEFGSNIHDEIGYNEGKYIRYSNNCGGIEGGMSNTEPIVIRSVMKPIPTLIKPLRSIDIKSKEEKLAAELKIKELVARYEADVERNVTDRWMSDMNSDSRLSKNVRPLMLIFLIVSTTPNAGKRLPPGL